MAKNIQWNQAKKEATTRILSYYENRDDKKSLRIEYVEGISELEEKIKKIPELLAGSANGEKCAEELVDKYQAELAEWKERYQKIFSQLYVWELSDEDKAFKKAWNNAFPKGIPAKDAESASKTAIREFVEKLTGIQVEGSEWFDNFATQMYNTMRNSDSSCVEAIARSNGEEGDLRITGTSALRRVYTELYNKFRKGGVIKPYQCQADVKAYFMKKHGRKH